MASWTPGELIQALVRHRILAKVFAAIFFQLVLKLVLPFHRKFWAYLMGLHVVNPILPQMFLL